MLRSLELENFKAFGSRTRIPFAPITLIFGENSAGKSTILQALNLLKQTRESRESGALLLPRTEKGFVDLGSFQELLFDHDLKRTLSIRVEADMDIRRLYPSIQKWLREIGEDGIAVELSFARPSLDEEVQLQQIQIYMSDSQECIAKFRKIRAPEYFLREMSRTVYLQYRHRLSPQQIRAFRCVWATTKPVYWELAFNWSKENCEEILNNLRQYESEIQKALEKNENINLGVDDLQREEAMSKEAAEKALDIIGKTIQFFSSDYDLEAYIARMIPNEKRTIMATDGFVPVTSHYPARRRGTPITEEKILRSPNIQRYRPFENRSLDVGRIVVTAGNILEDILEKLFPMGPFRRPPERWYIFTGTTPQDVGYRGDLLPDLLFRKRELVKEANNWLERLNIGYKLNVESLGPRSKDLFEVRLVDTRRKKDVDVGLPDVGFGISQILPFIVQSLASENQIISIEQPEVHIHPRLQADLGDLLAEAIKKRHNQFIIETHSEHLILRLQRLVHEKKIKPTDVSVVYVSRGSDGARAERLNLDEDGDFEDEWPGGFFPERLRELR